MNDEDLSQSLHTFTSSGGPGKDSDLLELIQRRRRRQRRRVAIGSGALAIGVLAAGITVRSVLINEESPTARGSDDPSSAQTPRVPAEDISCGGSEELTFAVSSWESQESMEEISGDTPEDAAGPWLSEDQKIVAVFEDGSKAKVQVASGNGATISVIALRMSANMGWQISTTTACVDPATKSEQPRDCGGRVELADGRAYEALPPQPVLGPGDWIGQGVVPSCGTWTTPAGTLADPRAGSVVQPRGPVAPVTLFRESEVSPRKHSVAVVNDRPTLLEATERD